MKRRTKHDLIILTVVLGFLLAQIWLNSRANPKGYDVQGIDVSHHQGRISWRGVGLTNIDFVYMKATEGGDWVDPRFTENWAGAKHAGLAVGGYHYFSTCRSGHIQAENFLKTVGTDPDNLPAALDLEFGGFCGGPQSKDTLMKEAQVWIEEVERVTRKPVIIYTTYDFHAKYLVGEFKDNPFWLRSIGRPPHYKGRRKWAMWQWHNAGRVTGVSGDVDRNVFHGSEADFEKYQDAKISH